MVPVILVGLAFVFYFLPLFRLGEGVSVLAFLTAHTTADIWNSGFGLGLVLVIAALIIGFDDIGLDWLDWEDKLLNLSVFAGVAVSAVLGLLRLVPWLFSLPFPKMPLYLLWFLYPAAVIVYAVRRKESVFATCLVQLKRDRPLQPTVKKTAKTPLSAGGKTSGKPAQPAAAEDKDSSLFQRDAVYKLNLWFWCACVLGVVYIIFNFYTLLESDSFMKMVTQAIAGRSGIRLSNLGTWPFVFKLLFGVFVLSVAMTVYHVIRSKEPKLKVFAALTAAFLLLLLLARILVYSRYLIPFVAFFFEIAAGLLVLLIIWFPIGFPVVCLVSRFMPSLPVTGGSGEINAERVVIEAPAQDAGAEQQKEVHVWRRNGLFTENLKVNSDNSMYYDPEDEAWHKIPQSWYD